MSTTEEVAEREEAVRRTDSNRLDRSERREDSDRRRERDASTAAFAGADGRADTARASVRARTREKQSDMGWLWKVPAALGGLSLLGAVGVVVLPGTVVQPVQFATETVRALRSLGLLLGAFVGVIGLYVAYHRDSGDDRSGDLIAAVELPAANPERSHGPTNDVVGTEIDHQLDRVGGMVDGNPGNHYTAYKVKQRLAALARRVVADATGCSEERAREHVDEGTWTDDVRAASFLGGPDAPERTLAMRIRDWASGSTFDRQVVATVNEIVELEAGDES